MTEKPMDSTGAVLAIFLCLLFGSNALAIKLSLFGLSPYACVMLRFLVASLIILAYSRFKKIPLALSTTEWGHAVAMGVIFGLQMAVFYVGITYTTVSHAGVLMNTQPFFVAIMAHFMLPDDRLTLRKVSGIVLASVGAFDFETAPGQDETDQVDHLLFVFDAQNGFRAARGHRFSPERV